mgnify:CR=1 FL=1
MSWFVLRASDAHGFGAIDGEKMIELLLPSNRVREELDAHGHFFRLKVLVSDDRQHDGSDAEKLLQTRLLYVDLGHAVEAGVFISHAEGEAIGLFVDRLGDEVDGGDPFGAVEAVYKVPGGDEEKDDHECSEDSATEQPEVGLYIFEMLEGCEVADRCVREGGDFRQRFVDASPEPVGGNGEDRSPEDVVEHMVHGSSERRAQDELLLRHLKVPFSVIPLSMAICLGEKDYHIVDTLSISAI